MVVVISSTVSLALSETSKLHTSSTPPTFQGTTSLPRNEAIQRPSSLLSHTSSQVLLLSTGGTAGPSIPSIGSSGSLIIPPFSNRTNSSQSLTEPHSGSSLTPASLGLVPSGTANSQAGQQITIETSRSFELPTTTTLVDDTLQTSSDGQAVLPSVQGTTTPGIAPSLSSSTGPAVSHLLYVTLSRDKTCASRIFGCF